MVLLLPPILKGKSGDCYTYKYIAISYHNYLQVLIFGNFFGGKISVAAMLDQKVCQLGQPEQLHIRIFNFYFKFEFYIKIGI